MKKIIAFLVLALFALHGVAFSATSWTAPMGSNPAYKKAFRDCNTGSEQTAFATYVAKAVTSFVHQGYEEAVPPFESLVPEILAQLKEGKPYTLELGAHFIAMNAGSYDRWSIGDFVNRSEPFTGIGIAVPVNGRLVYGMVITAPGQKTGVVCSNVLIDKIEDMPEQPAEVQVGNDRIVVEPGTSVGAEVVRAVLIGLNIGSQSCDTRYGDRRDYRRDDGRAERFIRHNDRDRYDNRRDNRRDDGGVERFIRHNRGGRDDRRTTGMVRVQGREQTMTHTQTTVSGTRGYMVNRVTGERVLVNDRGTVTTRTETATRRQERRTFIPSSDSNGRDRTSGFIPGNDRGGRRESGFRPSGNRNRDDSRHDRNSGRDRGDRGGRFGRW